MPDTYALAWLAGFWDGEGCTSTTKSYATPVFALSQAGAEGEELCRHVLDSCGIPGAVNGPYLSKYSVKPRYVVTISGGPRVKALLEMCRPWLSRVKIEQAERALARWEQYRVDNNVSPWQGRPTCNRGHLWTEESTGRTSRGGRRCLICHRDDQRARNRKKTQEAILQRGSSVRGGGVVAGSDPDGVVVA